MMILNRMKRKKKNDRAEETLSKLKGLTKGASEDKELFNQQYNNFKVTMKDLDKQTLSKPYTKN